MGSSDGDLFEGSDEHEHEEGADPGHPSADPWRPRGWVPPEEREWRHPSEIGGWAGIPTRVAPRPSGRRTAWATAFVGAGAVAALVTGGLMLASQSGPASQPTTAPLAPPTSATRSIVRLDVAEPGSTDYGCGIVVGAGGLVATDASLLVGARGVVALTSSGKRERASIVAIDPDSDVGLVRVDGSLPVARVVDWSELQPGTGAVELAVEAHTPGEATSAWWSDTIASAAGEVGSGPGQGMASIVATTPRGANPAGAVLLEHDGAVVGLLDTSGGASAGGGAVFLPGEFVVAVAHELMNDDGKIEHGWRCITGTDSGSGQPKGALVTAVDPSGASANRLRPGDVIEELDGSRVRSMADLRSRLYLLAPGTEVKLAVERGDSLVTVDVALRASA